MRLPWILLLLLCPAVSLGQDKVYHSLTTEQIEAFLAREKIEFKKTKDRKENHFYYDFKRETFAMRLSWFDGKDLLLDCVFRAMPVEQVNHWNVGARFSRANLQKEKNTEITVLEYALDLVGGVTDGTVKQFFVRFEQEVRAFDQFAAGPPLDTAILPQVDDERLEPILKGLGIEFQKKTNDKGVTAFEFEVHKTKVKLYNYGGKELMLDSLYKPLSLEAANKYNLNRKFVRVVNYKSDSSDFTALEANFDCTPGVTAGMIRHFVLAYTEDVRHFGEFQAKTK